MLLLALMAAAFTATQRANALKAKLLGLWDTHGLITQDFGREGDLFSIVPIGEQSYEYDDIFLLRLSRCNEYQMRIHHFDGLTGKYSSVVHKCSSIQTAVRLLPSQNQVYAHNATLPIENETFFDITTSDIFFRMQGHRGSDVIGDSPISGYCMLTSEGTQPSGVAQSRYANRQNIEETCRLHKMIGVWFTLEPISE